MGLTGKYGRKGPLGGGQRAKTDGDDDSDIYDESAGMTKSEALDSDIVHGAEREARDGDITGYIPILYDLCPRKVYTYWVHNIDGGHLNGGIVDDATQKYRWWDLSMMPAQCYDFLRGKVGGGDSCRH